MSDVATLDPNNTFGVPGIAGFTASQLDDLILRTGIYIQGLSWLLDMQKALGQVKAATATQAFINAALRRVVAMDKARATLPA